jgi:hypothetical protein
MQINLMDAYFKVKGRNELMKRLQKSSFSKLDMAKI